MKEVVCIKRLRPSFPNRWSSDEVCWVPYACTERHTVNDHINMFLYLLSVWDRWESLWQNAGPTTQPPASQPCGWKRHLPRCQNHRISSCEWALHSVRSHIEGVHYHTDSGPGYTVLAHGKKRQDRRQGPHSEIRGSKTLSPDTQNVADRTPLKTCKAWLWRLRKIKAPFCENEKIVVLEWGLQTTFLSACSKAPWRTLDLAL